MGVSENIVEAGWQALSDGFAHFLLKQSAAVSNESAGKQTEIAQTGGS